MVVKAESGFPIPPQNAKGLLKYPWPTMDVGQSFPVACKGKNSAHSMAHQANAKYAPKKFRGGRADGGSRIWRVE